MNWRDHKTLAVGLRDQALADCIAARFALRPATFSLHHSQTTLAHLVTAKCQQSVEKLTKGYLLWHSGSFDPTRGHTPFTRTLGLPEKQRAVIDKLCMQLNRLSRRAVAELKWLESLAPHSPEALEGEKGYLQPLEGIQENSEYPYWSTPHGRLVTAAEGLDLEKHGVRAIKAVRIFFEAMALSDPRVYTKAIEVFLVAYSFSTAITEWPEPEGPR
jgi:hypothetical protein